MIEIQIAKPEVVEHGSLTDTQQTLFDIVHEYVKGWHAAKHDGAEWPEPLRLFLAGKPGSGKTTATKITISELFHILGEKKLHPYLASSYQ